MIRGEALVATDCQTIQEILTEHGGRLEGLGGAESQHLEVCPDCREVAAAERALGLLFARAIPPADPSVEEGVLAALRPVWIRRRIVAFLPVAASLLVALVGAVMVGGVPGSGILGLLPEFSAQGWMAFASQRLRLGRSGRHRGASRGNHPRSRIPRRSRSGGLLRSRRGGRDRPALAEGLAVARRPVIHFRVPFFLSLFLVVSAVSAADSGRTAVLSDLRIDGPVAGDVVVFGADLELGPGARVEGDAVAVGGDIRVADGAVVSRHVVAVFGGAEVPVDADIGGKVLAFSSLAPASLNIICSAAVAPRRFLDAPLDDRRLVAGSNRTRLSLSDQNALWRVGCALSRDQGSGSRDDGGVDGICLHDCSTGSRPRTWSATRRRLDVGLLRRQSCGPDGARLLDRCVVAPTLVAASPSDQSRGLCRCPRAARCAIPAGDRRNRVDPDIRWSHSAPA